MAHEYSIQVHAWLKEKIDNVNMNLKQVREKNDSQKESYYKGQLEQLREIRQYLTDKIDLDTQKYY